MNAISPLPSPAATAFPRWRAHAAGLLLTATIAMLSLWLSRYGWLTSRGIGALTIAIFIGMLLGNTVYPAINRVAGSGVAFSKAVLLRTGIVLYGLRLTFQDIAQVGMAGVLVDALVMSSTFVLAAWLGTRLLGLERTTALLVGAGSSICGAAAVMATAPVLRGRTEQVTAAVASVVVFGTLAMFVYPLLYRLGSGHGWLAMTPQQYGVYTGSTVHEVAQVYAAGRSIDVTAADTAVITKMVRVMMLAPFLLLLSWWLARRFPHATGQAPARITVPWFAFGFVAAAAIASLHLLPIPLVQLANSADTLFLSMAMSALGLTTHASALRKAGPRPLLLAGLLFAWLVLGGFAINLGMRELFV